MNAQQAIAHALADLVNNGQQFTNYDVTKHARSFTDENVRHNDVIAYVSVEMDEEDSYYVDTVSVPKGAGSVAAVLYSPDSMYAYQYSPNDIQTDKSLKGQCCGGTITGCTGTSPAVQQATAAAAQAAATVKKFQAHTQQTPNGNAYTVVKPVSNFAKTPHQTTLSNLMGTGPTSKVREVVIDNRGRVCIPKSFIDRIGKGAGDVVYVQKSSVKGSLVISAIKWSTLSHTPLTTNQVDCYGNVRITPKSLNKCNISKTTKNGSEYVKVRSESDHIVIE